MYYLAYSKKAAHQGMVPGQVGPGGPPPPGGQGSDPMSALRSLASQGGNTTLVGQPNQMGGVNTPILVPGNTGGGLASQTGLPQQQQTIQMSQPSMLQGNPSIVTSMAQQGINPMMIPQTRFMPVNQLTPQQQQQVQHQLQQQQQQLQQQQLQQQQAQQQQQLPPHSQQQAQLQRPQQMLMAPNVQLQVQRMRQQVPQQMHQPGGPGSPMIQQVTSPAGAQFQAPNSQGPSFQCNSPIPQLQSQGPNSNQPIPSPAQQLQVSSIPSGPQLTPSSIGYVASPSSQVAPSPGNFPVRTPINAGVPSPGSALNTPAAVVATPSPATRAVQDDHLYLEKLKHLQKFVEPLRRMILRIDKDENKKKEQSQLKGLLDILTDPNKRCPMDTLLKCEQVLERLELKGKAVETALQTGMQPVVAAPGTLPLKPQEQNICQPLLDAIASKIRSPLINHTLQRTFGPVIAALCGPSPRVPSPPPKRRKIEEDPCEIADVLQGEIARLDQRFKVQMDPVQHHGSKTVHLICQLDDKNLPCVPPINITVPANYPDRPPKCHIDKEEYESTPFLQSIKRVFCSHINSMPQRTSVSYVLDTWEMSVRQACAPPARAIPAS